MAGKALQGSPCWYELGTTDLDAAGAFYGRLLGWTLEPTDMPGIDYRTAASGGQPVAGLMSVSAQVGNPPPNWVIYFTADDCDAIAARVIALRGSVCVPPTDIPSIGRFAILADPQGAVFAVLTPLASDSGAGRAFDATATGHGQWHELMTTDPKAALAFYGELFGWRPTQALDMGADGLYQLFAHAGHEIGAVMGLGQSPKPAWIPYFGVGSAAGAVEVISGAGGTVLAGPMEVPGPALIVVALDPQGAAFSVVAPKPR